MGVGVGNMPVFVHIVNCNNAYIVISHGYSTYCMFLIVTERDKSVIRTGATDFTKSCST